MDVLLLDLRPVCRREGCWQRRSLRERSEGRDRLGVNVGQWNGETAEDGVVSDTGRTVLLFRLFCLIEDDVLFTDTIYRVLFCMGRHAETLVRRLVIVILLSRLLLLLLNCKYIILLITNMSTQQ
ncbi:Hypothetical predicted protein [Scomber scombrus]|uniref:Uncharacterized protein n=1 Tax=Scomber scombrus TaxID=13677 RepID=A0AAV1QJY0_SCOSC